MLSPRPGTPPLYIPPFARVLALRADMELCIDTVAQLAMCTQECELTSCCASRARADIVLRMKIFRVTALRMNMACGGPTAYQVMRGDVLVRIKTS